MFIHIKTNYDIKFSGLIVITLFMVRVELGGGCPSKITLYVTRFAKTRHNDAFLKFQIFTSVSSIYLKLCSVVISMLYCKYFSSYKAR